MIRCCGDHLVVTALSLADGMEFIRQSLGVPPQKGGEHGRMRTHNCLLRLGEATYLEVIAINPDAPSPGRPRWFELDRLDAKAAHRLAAWVARNNDIHAAAAASPIPLGTIVEMSPGNLNWLITIPADGSLQGQGVAPMLIQWQSSPHPAEALQDLGCSLVRVEGFHPEAGRIAGMLGSVGFKGEFSVSTRERPGLVAHVRTPSGIQTLGVAVG